MLIAQTFPVSPSDSFIAASLMVDESPQSSSSTPDAAAADPSLAGDDSGYVVVARRYRPKDFTQLVGQEHVGQALSNAIETGRVGHAYLFTGARGVGKTSTARIFAKALNNPGGASAEFDHENDIAQAIDAGEDIDVIEIDGASNRGIDEIRSLRANVGVRPSRARYKIYIIDEVHMLTTAAFNALLKTLEEPPEHVKFIFCTTDPEKLPITVLSRCQRFDFAPVEVPKIVGRLREIVISEQIDADDQALELIARRAAGSMRDSQSLLEQVLSFCSGKLTPDQVHSMLGTADDQRLHALAQSMAARDPAETLQQLDLAVDAGIDAGRLAEQLLGYFRDLMAVTVGCQPSMQRHTPASMYDELQNLGNQWGLQTVLAVVGMLDETLVRIRHSVYGRVLLEATVIQICSLPDLQAVADLAAAAAQQKPLAGANSRNNPAAVPRASAAEKKKVTPGPEHSAGPMSEVQSTVPSAAIASAPAKSGPTSSEPTGSVQSAASSGPPAASRSQASAAEPAAPIPAAPIPAAPIPAAKTGAVSIPLSAANLSKLIDAASQGVEPMTASFISTAHCSLKDESTIKMEFPAGAGLALKRMDLPEHRGPFCEALSALAGQKVGIELVASKRAADPKAAPAKAVSPKQSAKERMERMREIEAHPWVQTCVEQFDAQIVKVDPKR